MDASKLTERLRGILKPPSGFQPSGLPASVFAGASPADPSPSLERELGGVRVDGIASCFVVERRVAAESFHGDARVEECAIQLERSSTRASLLMRNEPAQSPFVFFDLETTGLSGGAGTYAFLIGCGWFSDDGSFVTRQYFLVEHDGERSMLRALADEFDRAGVLVSFNGKSFDAPLLETRYLFHRLEWRGGERPHLDLLHPARRFWGGAVDESGCSLGALERKLVRVQRRADVPGYEIPARYFQFIRSGDARLLSAVFEHNRQDLLSLAVLTARLLQLVDSGSGTTADAREALALGHVYANSGLDGRAREAYRRAVALTSGTREEPTATSLGIAALRGSALAERRARAYDEAAVCWQRLLDLPGCPPHVAGEALEALAIHHEHRARDLAKAKAFALRSVERESRPSWNDAARHRLARLDKKLRKLNEPLLFPFSSLQLSFGSPTSARRTSS